MKTLTIFDGSEKKPYLRWLGNERAQHWILAISFILLVLTGFALKYPESWWVQPFLGIEVFPDFRAWLHRVAGAAFIILGIYHAFYMAATRRGRELGKAFLPNRQDLKDFMQNMSFNLGHKKQPPAFGHFSYMEKAEYLALIWGGVIMGVTGLMLWFENITLLFFPLWVIDLLTVIHLYEAWLATLAIVVWHFYYVIFSPEIYPVNTSMVDGRLTEEQMRHEYYQEWQQIHEEQGQDSEDSEDGEDKKETSEVRVPDESGSRD